MTSKLKLLSTTLLLATITACSGGVGSDSGSSGGGTPPQTFSVSVTLTGLASGQSVTLQNNGSDTIELGENYNDSSYTFITEIADQSTYNVTVSAQPTDQTCVVENGSGTIDRMIVNNITVECVDGSYSKINSDGDEVSSTADDWDCVQDYETGQLWEVKTNDGGLRDTSWTYSWYDTNRGTNGGDRGRFDAGICVDNSYCDTQSFTAQVNSNGGICGYTDWRMPTKDELAGLLTCSDYPYCGAGPHIDQAYFPNTVSYYYWSSTVFLDPFHAMNVGFDSGRVYHSQKFNDTHVRLVRDATLTTISITGAGNGTVSDDSVNVVSCSADCNLDYSLGDTVTLTATPDSGNEFTGWTGDCDIINGNECTITITASQSVAANFTIYYPYIKIGSSGNALANQTLAYNATGSEVASDKWDCVQDNASGLLWEVKTDGGLRDKDWAYSWYNTDPATNGGDWGIGDTGTGTTTGFETYPGTFPGSDNCSDSSRCDTEKFVADVNNNGGICGHSDWRLPTIAELSGLLNCTYGTDCDTNNAPLLEQSVFPNTQSIYWSSSAFAFPISNDSDAWFVSFYNGYVGDGIKDYNGHVRLVRGSQ